MTPTALRAQSKPISSPAVPCKQHQAVGDFVPDAGLKSKIYDMFGEVLGAAGDTIMKDSDMTGSNLQKTASPAIFRITANSVYFGFDLSALACIRFTLSGIRSCILARFSLVAKHASEQSGLINANLSASAVVHWLQHVSKEKLEAYMSTPEPCMWWCTVSAGDLLYVPAGFIMAERTMNQAESTGLRFSMVVKSDKSARNELQCVEADGAVMGRANPARQEAIAMYT